jgi:hypothetical protein
MDQDINSVKLHPQLSHNQASGGWCNGQCWFKCGPTMKMFSESQLNLGPHLYTFLFEILRNLEISMKMVVLMGG